MKDSPPRKPTQPLPHLENQHTPAALHADRNTTLRSTPSRFHILRHPRLFSNTRSDQPRRSSRSFLLLRYHITCVLPICCNIFPVRFPTYIFAFAISSQPNAPKLRIV